MFGRATIRLGIGPHSSFKMFSGYSIFISFHTWFRVKINTKTFFKSPKDFYTMKLFLFHSMMEPRAEIKK